MRILVAEDDLPSRRLLVKALESWDFEVLQAADGAEAWQRLQAEPVQMIVTDWMMPRMPGPQLCRLVRQSPDGQYAYIILLTSRSDKESLIEGLAAGADDFITKPFEREELHARIRAGQRILDLQQELHAHISRLAELNERIAQSNRQMKDDLEAAAAVQRTLLPARAPEVTGVSFAWQYRPCTELGGDCLNVFRLDRDHFGLYVLDVSGHGVQAALLSVTLSRILSLVPGESSLLTRHAEGCAAGQSNSPTEVAGQLNRQFPLNTDTGQYFTLLYGILNHRTGEFRYSTAGQPGPAHLPYDREPAILQGYGLPIGFCENPCYEEHSVLLRPGDRLYLFTDGIIEAHSPGGEQFGEHGLCNVLAENRHAPLADGLSSLLERVEAWCGDEDPKDDITALAVEMVPQPAAVADSPTAEIISSE